MQTPGFLTSRLISKYVFSLFQFASLGLLVSFIVTCAKHPGMTNLSLDGCTMKSQDVSSGRYDSLWEETYILHMSLFMRKPVFQPGPTQTNLHSHRRWLEALVFGLSNEPCQERTCLGGFQPGPTQTGL